MIAQILGGISGTLLAMFWMWRNLNEFSTMTVKEVAKVLTQGIGIAIVAAIVLAILFTILNEGIDIVCAGLDQDSRGKPWETSAMILGLSDKILKIYGFCNVCGMEATKTYRKEEGGGRTQVGAANIYEPRCLKHWTAR